MKVVVIDNDWTTVEFPSVEDMLNHGSLVVKGYTEDLSGIRAQGGFCHRVELDNQPILEGFAGPMWDDGGLRYEAWNIYEMLSR